MKILWLSNYRFSNNNIKTTGTWIKVMGEALIRVPDLELVNITNVKKNNLFYEDIFGIRQYCIPILSSLNNELPDFSIVRHIEKIIEDENPDIIHVWGTECYWGLITKKYVHRFNVLLEIQGLISQILQQYYGGLTFKEVLRCTGFKELIKPKYHLLFQYYFFNRQAQNEQDIIRSHKLISIQSAWTQRSIESFNMGARIFKSLIPIREEFVKASKTWSYKSNGRIFTAAAGLHSFKGLHVAIKALSVLIERGENVTLNIAGAQSKGIKQSGYKRYLLSLIKNLKLESRVNWLEALDANEIVRELQISDVVLIPSFIESYCMVLYESLCIGLPVVCSCAGAMPEAGLYSSSIKYFQPGDYTVAASYISDFLSNKHEFKEANSVIITSEEAVARQLSIYNRILS